MRAADDPKVGNLTTSIAIGAYAVKNDPYGPNGTKQEDPGYPGFEFNILTNQAVPEPATIVPILGMLLAAAGTRRRWS